MFPSIDKGLKENLKSMISNYIDFWYLHYSKQDIKGLPSIAKNKILYNIYFKKHFRTHSK